MAAASCFLVEREGRIRIAQDGALVETPFLNIARQALTGYEVQGLLHVAFPPSYADRQRSCVSYIDLNGHTVISRFAPSPVPIIADSESDEVLLTISQPGLPHNVGTLKFGPRDGTR